MLHNVGLRANTFWHLRCKSSDTHTHTTNCLSLPLSVFLAHVLFFSLLMQWLTTIKERQRTCEPLTPKRAAVNGTENTLYECSLEEKNNMRLYRRLREIKRQLSLPSIHASLICSWHNDRASRVTRHKSVLYLFCNLQYHPYSSVCHLPGCPD